MLDLEPLRGYGSVGSVRTETCRSVALLARGGLGAATVAGRRSSERQLDMIKKKEIEEKKMVGLKLARPKRKKASSCPTREREKGPERGGGGR